MRKKTNPKKSYTQRWLKIFSEYQESSNNQNVYSIKTHTYTCEYIEIDSKNGK